MANKRIKKKNRIDGSFVREIASMQEKIDNYERLFWELADYAKNGNTFLTKMTEPGTYTEYAVEVIFETIEKYRECYAKEKNDRNDNR